ncbi:YdaS family helix-turn-helix protein [Crenobacter cavernae]|uniref:Helix-turn-helix domain-containing protein n=1 Tax=Crenobacter cavernae TaxID=2290923 RepID=A0ABY0FE43_9NEIS|nr:YdaS family helix-turn-helix protein [Crenobacter cavernae]RXZ42832.1 helix-turn-helix domain-containing protein [Crenobacter cavernae]
MDTKDIIAGLCVRYGGQVAFAKLVGVRQPTVSDWLRGVSGVSPESAISIENLTKGATRCEDICPNFPWREAEAMFRRRFRRRKPSPAKV